MKNIFRRINNILYYRILPKNLRFNYETQKRNSKPAILCKKEYGMPMEIW